MPFADAHSTNKRGTPSEISKYKLSLSLYHILNKRTPIQDWTELFFNQAVGSRMRNFKIIKSNNRRIGLNLLCNRLHTINNKIHLDWLNLSFLLYKFYILHLHRRHLHLHHFTWLSTKGGNEHLHSRTFKMC